MLHCCRSPAHLKLSTVYNRCPGLFDSSKIAVVEKFITEVDRLPKRFESIKVLYLSKNSLRSLEGVQQFRQLRTLSVADNLLASLDELAWLQLPGKLAQVEVLSLEGNPLARLPNYRCAAHAALSALYQRVHGP